MKYFVLLLIISLFSCQSSLKTDKTSVEFEIVNYYPFDLIKNDFQVINSQAEMDSVFTIIHSKINGDRFPPILTIAEEETFVIFKTKMKNSNHLDVKNVSITNKILYIDVEEIENPQVPSSNKTPMNVLLKIPQKVSIENLIINRIK